jgi:hypothetical protein
LEPQPGATTTELLQVVAEVQQAAAVAEPQQPAMEVEPQQAAAVTAATTAVAVAAPPTSLAPAAAGSPRAVVVEIPDDDDVLPASWDSGRARLHQPPRPRRGRSWPGVTLGPRHHALDP